MALTGTVVLAVPLGTVITYQGQLKSSSAPLDGTVAMTFQLFDALTAGASVSSLLSFPAVSVVNGLFTVDLDFGVAPFASDARYLQVRVNSVAVSPRQRIAPTPFALRALNAPNGHSLDAADGSPTDALFVNNSGFVGIGTTAPSVPLDMVASSQTMLSLSSSNPGGTWLNLANTNPGGKGWNLITTGPANGEGTGHLLFRNGTDSRVVLTLTHTGNVGIGTPTPDNTLHVLKGSAGTVTANGNSPLVVENSTDAYLSILTPDATERGILFGEPSNNAAGGITYNSVATPDGLQFRTNGNVTRMSLDNAGNVGIGIADAATPLDMALGDKRFQVRSDGGLVPGINLTGTGGSLGIMRIRNKIEMWPNDAGTTAASIDVRSAAGAVTVNLDGGSGNASFTGNLSFGSATRQMLNLWGSVYGIGVQGFTEYFRSDGGFAWFRGGSHNDATNNPGAGGSVLMVLDSSGNLGIGTTSPAAKLDVNGRTRTDSLEIVGGADLAEPFDIRSDEAINPSRDREGAGPDEGTEALRHSGIEVEPGTVVVIDPEHPGELRISTQANDPKVAGIVSGAKGLAPGMVLRSERHAEADGKHLVAMTGRVWCKCDTSSGPIRPGDLLTTSANAGHAMRVNSDANVPRGAILGKAMSELTDGTGLVLVLVNLQ